MSKGHGRYCEEESCLCPVHDTPLWYWPKGDLHACQDPTCEYAQEFDLDALRYKEMWESLDRSRKARRAERQHILDFFDSVQFRSEREGRWVTHPPEEEDDGQADQGRP